MQTNYCLYVSEDTINAAKQGGKDIRDNYLTLNCEFQYYHRLRSDGKESGNGNYSINFKNTEGSVISYIKFKEWSAYLQQSQYDWGGYVTSVKFIDKNGSDIILYTTPKYTIFKLPSNDSELYILEDLVNLISKITQYESVGHYHIQAHIDKNSYMLKGTSLESHMNNIQTLKKITDDIVEAHAKHPFSKTILQSFKNSIKRLSEQVGLSIDENGIE